MCIELTINCHLSIWLKGVMIRVLMNKDKVVRQLGTYFHLDNTRRRLSLIHQQE